MILLTQPHERLCNFYKFITVAGLNHATLHKAESATAFFNVQCSALLRLQWNSYA